MRQERTALLLTEAPEITSRGGRRVCRDPFTCEIRAPSGTLNSALVVRTSSLEPTSGRLRRSSFAGGRGSLPQSHSPFQGWNSVSSPRAPSSAPSVSLQTRGGPCGPPWNLRSSPVLLFSRLPDDRKDALLSPWTPSLKTRSTGLLSVYGLDHTLPQSLQPLCSPYSQRKLVVGCIAGETPDPG